ncbi:TIGR03936 family radical SAM-associated protein [Nocardioides sp. B-3]|uniref:TIGR03936 family radical SAM-associated protein n=1 Tax=Nocardioides sp. B-3 TaxID=2895565 RepID=UPI0021526D12|nr:TIGR03936 family radical SAM-associated protein [Nocardioides sp. B-3]UUZ60005.1 TIGR03936 family radical SAM-associated protein [Nocardioides sp. B-3]
MQRLRVRYAKRGRLRFTSHRDFSRAFERAVFRARIPMAYSSGFNPHPRMSYAGAAPTGSASEAEYLEIALARVLVPSEVHALLDEALPPGLDILEVVESPGGSLADRLEASRWRIDLSVPAADLQAAVKAFYDADEVLVERMTKKGLREFDARGAVLSITASGAGRRARAARPRAAPRRPRGPSRRRAHGADRRLRHPDGRGPPHDEARPGPARGVRRHR